MPSGVYPRTQELLLGKKISIPIVRTGKRPLDDKMKPRLDKVDKDEEEAILNFFASQQ